MADYKFPTEVVDLPSKGYFYPQGHPLSSGKVEIKYMTAKEEDILTSTNLIQQGTVIDVLLNSLIVTENVSVDELLIGDKNAIMVAARILGYGKEYEFKYDDIEYTADLTTLEPVDIDFTKFTKGKNEFEFTLPTSERVVTFKLLTSGDEKNIDAETKALQKISKDNFSELTTRFKYIILSVDGKSDKKYINNFIDNEFLSRDSLEFRRHMISLTPDVDMSMKVSNNGEEIEVTIPVTPRFFWPDTRV